MTKTVPAAFLTPKNTRSVMQIRHAYKKLPRKTTAWSRVGKVKENFNTRTTAVLPEVKFKADRSGRLSTSMLDVCSMSSDKAKYH